MLSKLLSAGLNTEFSKVLNSEATITKKVQTKVRVGGYSQVRTKNFVIDGGEEANSEAIYNLLSILKIML